MPNLRKIDVFISSPADVIAERAAVARIVARLDDVWKAHVRLNAVLWESGHYEAAQGFQESIGEMAVFDIVLGIVWKRVGSALRRDKFRREDGSAYESGTVFELETAIAHSEADGTPSVFLFRKTEPVTFSAEGVEEERVQYETLTKWWDRTVRNEDGNFIRGFQEFLTVDELERDVEDILESYLRDRDLIPAGAAWSIETRGSPFPGLLAYNSEYSDVFFGRSLAAAGAIDELLAASGRDTPALFIVGPSGSGKSSLARAGIAPRIDGNQIDGVDFWRKLLIEPAQDPLLEFSQKLFLNRGLPELGNSPTPSPESFAALCRQSTEAALGAIKWGLERAAEKESGAKANGEGLRAGRLLIVLDQLETFLDTENKEAVSALIRALVENGIAWLIATLRSDRYADLQGDDDLIALKRRGAMFDLPAPGASEIADIIKGPARAADLQFEERDGRSLANVINDDVRGADALPLLQMTLARLFDARDGLVLTYSAYDEIGGLEGAIAAHAEAIFETVSPEGQGALNGLLRSLVADIDDDGSLTLRTEDWDAFADDGASRELIEKLTEGRLLVNAEGTIRIAHEALLRRWRRASESPALQPEAIRLRRQIEPVFQVWERTRLDIDLLQPRTTTIAAADSIVREHAGVFPPDMEEYVQRSIAAAESLADRERAEAEAAARRVRRRAIVATVAAFAFAGLAGLAFVIYGKAQENLSLAMLTKAENFLSAEKPTRALVLANAAIETSLLPGPLEDLIASESKSEKDIRAASIAGIAGPVNATPVRTMMFAHAARSVAFDPNGTRYAAGFQNGDIVVTRTDGGGRDIKLVGHDGPVKSLEFSADGQWLASASGDRTVRLWNIATREVKTFCEHTRTVTEVAFDPQGRHLASASNDGHVIVRDIAAGTVVRDFTYKRQGGQPGGWMLSVRFSPDGSMLASTDEDGNLFIHDTRDWTVRRIDTGRADLISAAFDNAGKRIATASIDGSLDVWNGIDGSHIRSISDHRNKLWRVRFTPSGSHLAAASWDGTVRLWDARTFRFSGTIDGSNHWITDIAYSPDSSMLLTSDWGGAVRLWRAGDIRPMFFTIRDNERETLVGTYNRDGSRFVTGSRDRLARLYRVTDDGDIMPMCRVLHENWVNSVDFSGDGKKVVSIGTVDGRRDNVIRIWDAEGQACRPIRTIEVGDSDVRRAVFDPTRDRVAWSTRTGEIWSMDLAPGSTRFKFPQRHKGQVYGLEFSPDGKFIASAGPDRKIVVWDADTRKPYRELSGHENSAIRLRFAPDSRLLASSGFEEFVYLWKVDESESPIAKLFVRGRTSGPIFFDRKGEYLAIGSDARYLSIWSLEDRKKIFQLDALVGVRGVFGINWKRGDLAFDGENGLVRILPNAFGMKTPSAPANARLKGIDVFFDTVAPPPPDENRYEVIRAGESKCES